MMLMTSSGSRTSDSGEEEPDEYVQPYVMSPAQGWGRVCVYCNPENFS